jgi:hypothetical protein
MNILVEYLADIPQSRPFVDPKASRRLLHPLRSKCECLGGQYNYTDCQSWLSPDGRGRGHDRDLHGNFHHDYDRYATFSKNSATGENDRIVDPCVYGDFLLMSSVPQHLESTVSSTESSEDKSKDVINKASHETQPIIDFKVWNPPNGSSSRPQPGMHCNPQKPNYP